MNVPVTHVLDTGYDAHEFSPGVLIVDGLGAHLVSSLKLSGVGVVAVHTSAEFDASALDRQLARELTDAVAARARRNP